MNVKDLNLEVKCSQCHWMGELKQLHFSLTQVPMIYEGKVCPGIWDESHDFCCPACRSTNIIFREDSND